jgi:CoA-transferase family III
VALVSAWTTQHDKHDAMRLLGGAGIPAGAILDTKELIEDATLQQRAVLQVMEHPVVKGYRMPAWPVRHDGAPPAVKAAPLLEEHSTQVLKSSLGLSEHEGPGAGRGARDCAPLRRSAAPGRLRRCQRTPHAASIAEQVANHGGARARNFGKALKREGTDNLRFLRGGAMTAGGGARLLWRVCR